MKTAAQCSKAIKKLLTERFKWIKFSCTSQNYAWGNSVDVSRENGPTEKEVDDVIKEYAYGSFNWMDDIYEYSNTRDDIPQAKYVFARRYLSKEALDAIKEQCEDLLEYRGNLSWHRCREQIAENVSRWCNLPANSVVTWLKKTWVTSGVAKVETFRTLDYKTA